jgi:hypothetical protein
MARRPVSTRYAATVLSVAPATIRDWHRRGLIHPSPHARGVERWDLADLWAARGKPKPRRTQPTSLTSSDAGPHNQPSSPCPETGDQRGQAAQQGL